MSDRVAIIRKTFTLTERDVAILKDAMAKCGFVSESEALRAAIRYFSENAPCLKRP
jgi:Arc/MetJ-type ribon-helix-helix transcriptional regulator